MTSTSPFLYLASGLKLLTRKELRSFVLIPVAINAVLFIALNFWVFSNLSGWSDWIVDTYLPDWEWLRALLGGIVFLVSAAAVLVLSAYSFNFVAGLIAAPFNGFLAEKTEELLTGVKPAPESVAKMVLRTIGRELRKLGYFIPRALAIFLGCFLLGFVPIIGLVAPLIAFIWAAWSLSIQYADYSFDNHQLEFRDVLDRLGLKRDKSLSFGATIALISLIPIVNWFVMPAAVIGGVIYWVEEHQQDLVSPTK